MNQQLITTSQAVDPVFLWIVGISAVLLLGITAVTICFSVRYRRSRAPEPTSQAAGNVWLEIVWVLLSTLLVLAMFYYGWAGYLALRNVPKGALQVTATARMWAWSFTYDNGKTSPRLYVPVGRPVKVNIVSEDVLHGFYIPAFRVKRDAVPGMKNYAWFMASTAGSYDLFCSSYCGIGHSSMVTTVEAVPEAVFTAWLEERKPAQSQRGMAVMQKYGCLACHSLDGTKRIGPTLKGIWGHQEAVVTNGAERTVTVDEPYLRRSLLEPNADEVAGFQPVMPKFTHLAPDEIQAIVDFLKGTAGR
jgi:cytochrome c oxidase subunit 2